MYLVLEALEGPKVMNHVELGIYKPSLTLEPTELIKSVLGRVLQRNGTSRTHTVSWRYREAGGIAG